MGLWVGTQSSKSYSFSTCVLHTFTPPFMSTVDASQNFQTKTEERERKSRSLVELIPRMNFSLQSYLCLPSQLSFSCVFSPNPIKLKQEQRPLSLASYILHFLLPISKKNTLLVLVLTSARPARAHNPNSFWKAEKSPVSCVASGNIGACKIFMPGCSSCCFILCLRKKKCYIRLSILATVLESWLFYNPLAVVLSQMEFLLCD